MVTAGEHHDDDRHPTGSLTDVPGVRVGHHQRSGRLWQTGTTVVYAPGGAVAAVDVRGGGPGTRETDALAAGNLVDRVHAVCLTGGSAYGLSAADGVMAELEARGLGVPVGPDVEHVVPVVPAAVIFDLGRAGSFANRPDADFGRRALRRATTRRVARGAVGAGTGARAGGLQGGVGMASTVVHVGEQPVTVAALAVVNAAGSAIDPETATPWVGHPACQRPSGTDRAAFRTWYAADQERTAPLNTTIGVVATDAALTRPEAGRLALSAHDGLARAVRPAHLLTDGDTIFALSTGGADLPGDDGAAIRSTTSRAAVLAPLCAAAAEVFALACTDAVVRADTVGDAPAYTRLCPSARRT